MPTKNDQPLEARFEDKGKPVEQKKGYGPVLDQEFDAVPDEYPILYSAGKPYGFCGEGGERRVVRLR